MDELQRQYRHTQVGWQGRKINDFFPVVFATYSTIKWPAKHGFLSCINVFPKIGSCGESCGAFVFGNSQWSLVYEARLAFVIAIQMQQQASG